MDKLAGCVGCAFKSLDWGLKIAIVVFLVWFFVFIPLKGTLWHDGEIDTAILATIPENVEKQVAIERYLSGSRRTIRMRCAMDAAAFRQFCADNQLAPVAALGDGDALRAMYFSPLPPRKDSLWEALRRFFGKNDDWWDPTWVAIPDDDPAALRQTYGRYVFRVRFVLAHFADGSMHCIDYDLSSAMPAN